MSTKIANKTQYNIGREAAAKLLSVSMRTLDRYVKAKKLSTQLIDGRIWLDKGDLTRFKAGKNVDMSIDNLNVSTLGMSTSYPVDKVDNVDIMPQDFSENSNFKSRKRSFQTDSEIFEKLFEELKQDLNEKQQRLEMANYRVGQLENQIRNSISMLEYHRENFEKQKAEQHLREQMLLNTDLIKKLSLKLKYSKFSRRIFMILLLIIVALQPLWLLFTSFR